jgi:hypothetical protein
MVCICCVCCRLTENEANQSTLSEYVGTRNVHCSLLSQFYYLFLLGGEAFASLQRYSFCRAVCVLVTSGIPSLAGGVIFAIFIRHVDFLFPLVSAISNGIAWERWQIGLTRA